MLRFQNFGGSIAQWFAYLPQDPAAPCSILSTPQIYPEERLLQIP